MAKKALKERPVMAPIYITKASHRKLKVYAVNKDVTMSALLEEAITKLVAGR